MLVLGSNGRTEMTTSTTYTGYSISMSLACTCTRWCHIMCHIMERVGDHVGAVDVLLGLFGRGWHLPTRSNFESCRVNLQSNGDTGELIIDFTDHCTD